MIDKTFMQGLALLLIGLKLTGYIDWSWLQVLAPLWGPSTLFSLGDAFLYLWLRLTKGAEGYKEYLEERERDARIRALFRVYGLTR